MLLKVLRKAELARTNNFDLLQENGWKTLQEDITEDFPYLTLSELNRIIKLGYKGELDKYKSLTLNFPRVYQWVKQQAPMCLSYWHHKYPPPLRFVQLLSLEAPLLELLRGQSSLPNESVLRTAIKGLVDEYYYAPYRTTAQPADALHPRLVILGNQFQQWQQEYPEYASRFESQLF